jgi:hypothetical protein
LNTGAGKRFSDIGLYANVAATDWSWSPLFADFDNDGIKDIFISNGIIRRPNDLDFLKFISSTSVASQLQQGRSADKSVLQHMPDGKLLNYIFQGTRELKFVDQSEAWGFDQPSYSTGAAYADLDNDGDLDLLINNLNSFASVYENKATSQSKNHYLSIRLRAKGNNRFAYGSKVLVKTKDSLSMNYVSATRGFQSSSSTVLHFGLGGNDMADTLQIIWPDGSIQNVTNVKANQQLTIEQPAADINAKSLLPDSSAFSVLFRNYTDSIHLNYTHSENNFVDFNIQPLIPHGVSTQGPKLAVADVNGDGFDDFFICGAKGQPGKLFQQTKTGTFFSSNENLFTTDAFCEDVNAVFFDADNDNDTDLYVISGGNEATGSDSSLLDRLYINDGKGNFSRAMLPALYENKSLAVPADFDHDGDIDLFVGGRVVAKEYGKIPQSYLLLNNGKAGFTIASENICPGLKNIGMVTGAVWSDIDRDGWVDLIIAGEWMPVTVYKNEKGRLRNATSEFGLQHTTGLWTTLTSIDMDKDGYEDLLAGNWGENSKLRASNEFPFELYTGDIDGNGSMEQIMCIEKNGAYYTFAAKEEMEKLIPGVIRKKFWDYKTMAGKTVEEVLGNRISGLKKLSVTMLSSVLIKNDKGRLAISPLPPEIQWSPVFSFCPGDYDDDGNMDIISGGNFSGVTPYEGRYDAGFGVLALAKGTNFVTVLPAESGLLADGEIRDIKKIRIAGRQVIIIARTNGNLAFYTQAGISK